MINAKDSKKQTGSMAHLMESEAMQLLREQWKKEECSLYSDCLHRQTKCGHCVDKSNYEWDFTQMI
tara:strand:- start:20 stop:217 length:198 start_codon:yes stop_codon:yes gene_type:complete